MVSRDPFKPQLFHDSVVLSTQKQMLVPVSAIRCEVAIQNNHFSILLNVVSLTRQLGQMPVQENSPLVTP